MESKGIRLNIILLINTDWIERPLVNDEGVGIDGTSPKDGDGKSFEECKIWCENTEGCNSFSWKSEGNCYLKEKCLSLSDLNSDNPRRFKSYFKPCAGGYMYITFILVN